MRRLVAYWRRYDDYYRSLRGGQWLVHFVALYALTFVLSSVFFFVLLSHG